MDKDIFRALLQKHASGQVLSPEEEVLLQQGYNQLLEEELAAGPSLGPKEDLGTVMRNRINQRIANNRVKYFRWNNMRRIAAVFVVGLTLLAGSYWIGQTVNNTQLAKHEDILPGNNKAELTLADGSVISLDDTQNGTVAIQEGVRIEKDTEGNILYRTDQQPEAINTATNTVTTPNGGQYRITLPDGSIAMLNAASSLSYPVRFNGNERRVKMTGEVYFEIEKLPLPNGKGNVPFFVEAEGQEVQVLGTHFNINAYRNEASIKTTLVEGSVKVKSSQGQSVLLKPGQEAVLTDKLEVQQADISQQLAWVNGDFVFKGETLEAVLRQVARWYDVEVEYPPHIGKLRFNGMVSRSKPLSAIAKMIQATKKASVKIKERRLMVTD